MAERPRCARGPHQAAAARREVRAETKDEKMEAPGARTSPASKPLLSGTRRRTRGAALLS